uniref:Transmembrane protein n=1 Tax=Heterorhabditis bacteriophora TaxID=37862 RepID=A0A1I7XH84_HETBA
MAEIIERCVEQIQTTTETLRRRAVAYYDGIFLVANRCSTVAERLRDVAEPIAYDIKDYIGNAMNQKSPITDIGRETKNNIVELYLGISVLLIGLSAGQLVGAFVLCHLFNIIFDRYVEFLMLLLVPVYIYMNIRKNAAMDETERRTSLFGYALMIGALCGHLFGPSMTDLSPAIFFLPPLIMALLIDNELLVTPLASMDRYMFLYLGGALSVTCCTLGAVIPLGHFSLPVSFLSILHVAFMSIHFQCTKEKILNIGYSQFAYVTGLLVIQLVVNATFGFNHLVKKQFPELTSEI